jgi:Reverse transcriptase (RNA-dependent DNA polymerase)
MAPVIHCVGGVLSPLLANIVLSTLDDYFVQTWQQTMSDHNTRYRRRRKGLANWRLIRYADDWVVMVAGTRADTEALREEIAAVLAPMGLRLSPAKTTIVHLREGFDFLGFHIQRQRKRGTSKRHVYTYPSEKALTSVKQRIRALTCQKAHPDLATLLQRVNALLRAGVITSGTAARAEHSATSTTTRGGESPGGSAIDTPACRGRSCGARYSLTDTASSRTGLSYSTLPRSRLFTTAGAATTSPLLGHSQHHP